MIYIILLIYLIQQNQININSNPHPLQVVQIVTLYYIKKYLKFDIHCYNAHILHKYHLIFYSYNNYTEFESLYH